MTLPSTAERLDVDVLVVGSGIAGLTAALEVLRLAPGAHVAVATKAALGDGATAWAQGGIAAVLPDGDGADPLDAVALHVADTLAAGDGLCAADAVAVLCGAGADAVAALQARGLRLDRRTDGRLARGLEAAHSRPRIVHAGGDTTGAHVARALGAAVRASRAALLERTALESLWQPAGPGTPVAGARLRGPGGEELLVRAGAVVLATGGHAQVYAHTTTPSVATGDGLAAAVRAGAVARDVEMVQFHPTTAVVGSHQFLVSEAVRGAGAVLRDAAGERFTDELATRDVVARACAAAMAAQDGVPVLLDATGVDGLRTRFPGIDALTRAAGLDWTREPVPVTPAAHYAMGGVLTDLDGRTTLPGLWAVGEVASTGVHGANRLASNSLLEGAVFGARAAAALLAGNDHAAVHDPSGKDHGLLHDRPEVGDLRLDVELPGGAMPRAELRELVWEHAGLLRDRAGLELLAKTLAGAAPRAEPADAQAPEDRALTDVAALLTAGALAREESRGAHARTDHPRRSDPARHVLLRVSA